ncbi:MAG: hypothetical protein JWR10_2394 [Rubritepida sp.]|nr:hypothetical protein [Rubritepida sp.]
MLASEAGQNARKAPQCHCTYGVTRRKRPASELTYKSMSPPDHVPAEAPATPRADAVPPALRRPLFALLALIPSLIFLATVLSPPMNHDVAAVLDFAMRWRAGEALYRDLIDMNPPLIFMLTRGAVAAGEWVGVGPIHSLLAFFLLVCASGAGLALWLRRGLAEGPIEAACLTFCLPLTLLIAGYDFGQREHLMFAAAMPYLMLSARRIAGLATPRALVLAVALFAGTGFMLKPHFLAVPALVELYLLIRLGWRAALRDPVRWAMAALWVAYLALIFLVFPDYPGFVIPLTFEYYHSSIDFAQLLLGDRMAPALLLFLPVAYIALRYPRGLAPPLALAGLGALAAAIVQERGWSYHVLPIRLAGGLLAVMLVARWLDATLAAPRARHAAPAVAAIAAALLGLQGLLSPEAPWRQLAYSSSWTGVTSNALRGAARGGRVLVLSPDIFPVFPIVNYAGALSTLPTMNLWLLQGANQTCLPNGARYRAPAEMGPGERLIWDAVTRDFPNNPPEALMVSGHTALPYCGGDFDFLEYFGRDPRFAETFRRYRQIADFNDYRIFRREDP